jgi:RND family efflux transporter MFP subunit
MKVKKHILVIGIAAIVSAGCAFALIAPKADAKKAPTPVPSVTVNLVAPQPATFARAVAATGTVSARDELSIGSDASGVRLLEVLVDVGSVVRKGDLLARGDDAQLQAQLAQQVAQVKQAQAEHAQALANLERAERALDFFSVETVQTRRTSAATAAAKVDLAQAQRRELEVKISQTRVVAPAAGVVSRRSATVGAVVQPGTELFRLIRDGQLEWRAELPSHSLARISAGTPVRLSMDDGQTIQAQVRLVAPTIDTNTRNGVVYVALPQGTRFKAGAHARGEILVASAEALALPEASVLARDGYPFVYTVGPDSIARLKRIETGARQNGLVEISKGIDQDARVVATGAGFVKDGDLVRISNQEPTRMVSNGGQS